MKADHFVLSIELGNDAMQTWGDIAARLRKVADEFERLNPHSPESGEGEAIRDVNGNRVGGWLIR